MKKGSKGGFGKGTMAILLVAVALLVAVNLYFFTSVFGEEEPADVVTGGVGAVEESSETDSGILMLNAPAQNTTPTQNVTNSTTTRRRSGGGGGGGGGGSNDGSNNDDNSDDSGSDDGGDDTSGGSDDGGNDDVPENPDNTDGVNDPELEDWSFDTSVSW